MKRLATCALAAALAITNARAQQAQTSPATAADEPLPGLLPSPADFSPASSPSSSPSSTGEKPSAELINDVVEPPPLPSGPDESPLPPLGKLPGEDNIFGEDLFGPSGTYTPPEPEIPAAPPIIEDRGEQERKVRVRFRTVRARFLGDADVVALQEMAEHASTPEDHRAARRAYYALLFQKIRKADGSLSDYADQLEKRSLADLYQTRIEPTVPLTPPPQPQPSPQFIPARVFPEDTPTHEAEQLP